ncbi:MAG TPA: DUF3306 domain-containing protein [Kiloniellaceae bacterium]|nr:DUF3306 domain-containing protein [Kiloniellaceae bacterium]
MAAGKGDESKNFLSRWSERKRQAAEATREEHPEAEAGEARAAKSGEEAEREVEAVDPATLPDIDSLTAGSDFTVFMRAGVPEALKQRALRRLWQVDPAFNVICPLDDYNLDYTDAATVVPNLKTLYQVGRGMVLPSAEPETPQGGDDAAVLPSAAGESTPASLPPPDAVAAAERTQEPKREAVEAPPASEADAAESAPADPNRQSSASTPRRPDAARSARGRRWGDVDG